MRKRKKKKNKDTKGVKERLCLTGTFNAHHLLFRANVDAFDVYRADDAFASFIDR